MRLLSVEPTPPNDAFADATPFTGATAGTSYLPTLGATSEPSDPQVVPSVEQDGSVWFRWTTPAGGSAAPAVARFSSFGSSAPWVAGVYLGVDVTTLVPVVAGQGTSTVPLRWTATPATTYSLLLATSSLDDQPLFRLDLRYGRPVNDDVASAEQLAPSCTQDCPAEPGSATFAEVLRWMNDVLGPLLQTAVRAGDPVDVTGILAQMLQMGDEAHNRNRAGTLMLLRDLGPAMVTSGAEVTDVAEAVRFIGGNDHFFLNLAMPACKLALDAARGIDGSTMVVAMARNGTDFGIQVAGTGDEWFTGPAQLADGLYLGDYGPDDANPDIGDSAITETSGIGGFAMAPRPRSSASSAARCPTRWPPPGGCTRSPSARTRAGRCRCWSSRAPRPAST